MGAPRPITPIAVREANAARLLDMPATKFRSLVSRGALPPPVRIGDEERWNYAHIMAIRTGRVHQWRPYFTSYQDVDWGSLEQVLSDDYPEDYTLEAQWEAQKVADRIQEKKRKRERNIPLKVRRLVMSRDGRVCTYCGDESGPFELDHILPFARGGKSTADNLTVACRACNISKRDKTLDEWEGR